MSHVPPPAPEQPPPAAGHLARDPAARFIRRHLVSLVVLKLILLTGLFLLIQHWIERPR
ncbi:MAG: hypothetical protein JSR54_09215 [Proteobacteria bacterium]|nr:hypothetical protein [Pseudomonadota bacterium]